MTIQALKRKKQELLASQVSNLVSDTNENLLRVNLSKFFTDLEQEVQSALMEYWSDTMLLQGQVNLILASIHEKHQEYYELIMKHKLQEFHRAEQQGKRLVKRQEQSAMKASKPVKMTATRNNLFGTLKYSEDKLANDTFKASQNTLNRVDDNINQILTDGYKSGVGINEVSRQITERFDQLRTWEATRIARTEIHTAQNMGVMNSYESLGVEYTQWIAADDDRTRESHLEIDREIIPMGGTYSNGLAYPGDTSGPIEEWINCRCSNAPFVMPAGMMAPSFSPFREEDLIPIETTVEPTTPEPVETEPLTQSIFSNPKISQGIDELTHHEMTIYELNNGTEIHIFKNSTLSYEDVAEHMKTLPKIMQEQKSIIKIKDVTSKSVGGEHIVAKTPIITVYENGMSKAERLDVLNHELGHRIDIKSGGKMPGYTLSGIDVYEKIIKADNKLYAYTRPNGKKRTPWKFVTDYAGRSWLKYKKNKLTKNKKYCEDFAESVKLYLNKNTREEFIKQYPNRAEYLKEILNV